MELRVNEHIILRSYTQDDAAELFWCVAANRTHLRAFLPWVDSTLSEADSLKFIEITSAQADRQEGLALGIFMDGKLIGGIGMHDWNHHLQKCQIGYWLASAAQGNGYMLQCVIAFIDYLFSSLDLNKIEIQFVPFNTKSGALAEKLGAKVEGVIRQSIRLHGSYEDLVIAGILRKEWKERSKNGH